MDGNIVRALFAGMAVGLVAPTPAALLFGLTLVVIGFILAYTIDRE